MPRPKRPRHIFARPVTRGFMPETESGAEPVVISHEEFETVRLIDYQGMDQSQAAEQMGVSRQTVGRILKSARFKISQAIVDGRHFKIGGGCYRVRNGGKMHNAGCRRGQARGRGRGRGSGRPD